MQVRDSSSEPKIPKNKHTKFFNSYHVSIDLCVILYITHFNNILSKDLSFQQTIITFKFTFE
jgi:hypothetical protein